MRCKTPTSGFQEVVALKKWLFDFCVAREAYLDWVWDKKN